MTPDQSVDRRTPAVLVARRSPGQGQLFRTALTAVLMALFVSWMFTAWWTAPRLADVAQLDRSVAAGEVASYMRVSGFERSGGFWAASLDPQTDPNGATIVWQTTSGQTFYATPDVPIEPPGEVDGPGRANREAAAVEQRLASAGIPRTYEVSDASALAMILVAAGLIVLIAGPDPSRGTRWFWFWVAGAPAGLGVLAYLLLEHVWPSSRPVPANQKDQRWHGLAGLGVYLLAGVAWAMAIPELRDFLGSWVAPGS